MTTAALKSSSNSWTLRLFTLLIWLFVGLCTAYWAFKFVTTKPVEATAALATPTVAIDSKAVAKLLGATDNVAAKPLITAASTKFILFGLAKTANGKGVALIALDGKPARPYRVGDLVADDLVLKSISKTGVLLAISLSAPEGVTLELPERKPVMTVANIGNIGSVPAKTADMQVIRSVNPNNAAPIPPPAQTAAPLQIPPTVQANGFASGAAAAVSRFAPQASGQTPDGMIPGRPPGNGSDASGR